MWGSAEVSASPWQGSRVNALRNSVSEQMHGGVLEVLISLSAVLSSRPGNKVLWQPYRQCAKEHEVGEMGSDSTTNACKCVYDRAAHTEICEHRRHTAGQAHIYTEMPHTSVGTGACWGHIVHLREGRVYRA